MNNNFSLQQISRSGNLDSNLISRQNKLILMADFMQNNSSNPKLKQSEKANQLSYSNSILQRYRRDIIMVSPYRINPNNTNKRTKKPSILNSTTIHILILTLKDLKWPQMTSLKLKQIQNLIIEKIKRWWSDC